MGEPRPAANNRASQAEALEKQRRQISRVYSEYSGYVSECVKVWRREILAGDRSWVRDRSLCGCQWNGLNNKGINNRRWMPVDINKFPCVASPPFPCSRTSMKQEYRVELVYTEREDVLYRNKNKIPAFFPSESTGPAHPPQVNRENWPICVVPLR